MYVHLNCKPVTTDTVYFETKAIYDGCTCSQLFVGTKSLVLDVYGMKTDNNFVNILEGKHPFMGSNE